MFNIFSRQQREVRNAAKRKQRIAETIAELEEEKMSLQLQTQTVEAKLNLFRELQRIFNGIETEEEPCETQETPAQ